MVPWSPTELELLEAATSGDVEKVQRILDSKVIYYLSYQNEQGISPLHLASQHGHYDIVAMLLEGNFNKELKDHETGETALHKSAFHGHTDVLELLLQRGANKEAKSKNDSTALHLAAQAGHEASVQCLLSHQAIVDPVDVQGFTPLVYAAMYGFDGIVQSLLDNRSDKDRASPNGMTPLMCAARAGHASIVDLLLESGAKIDAECQAGLTAMMHAVKEKQLASAELLLDKGANPHHRDKNECTAIQLAVECGLYELTELLIERDADKAVLTQTGQSLLMLAAMNGYTDIVALLVKEEGQDVNCVNAVDGNTALHYASLTGQSETVKFLLTQCQAETNIVNKENNSARALALNAETREAFPPGTGTSFFGKVKDALSGLFGVSTSAPAENTSTYVDSDSVAARKRHQRLLREGQHLLARREWIKRRDFLHEELQTALKSSGYKEAQTRQLALDEHERTSSRIGIRESRYYTFPVRLLQSLSDLEGITTDVSAMAPSAVAAALDTRLQVLSQQRAGTDGIPLHNALTDKNYSVEELFLEINVLQQALNVPSLDLSTPVGSLLRGHRLAFENEIQGLLNQLALEGVHTIEFEELTNNASSASAQGVADRSVGSIGGTKPQQSATRNKAMRSYTAGEMASEITELKLLFKNVSRKGPPEASHVVNPLTAEPYTLFDVLDRAQNLRYALYDDPIVRPDSSASSEVGKAEAQAVLHYNYTLHQLVSRIQKECPSLVWFYPKTSMFWLGNPAKHLLEDSVMMVFVCPVTLKVMKCGPQGTGWEVRAPKELLKAVMPALLLSLFVMQAAVLEGREVQIPLSWQYSPVSVADEQIPSKLVKTALTERFEADHCMRCLAAFTDAVKTLADLSDPSLKLLCLKLSLQWDSYKQTHLRSTTSTYPKISLGIEFTPKMFEASYKSIHSFLTTGENAKLGKLVDQLRGSMERVMAEDGDVEWVGLGAGHDWLLMHARLTRDSDLITGPVNPSAESVVAAPNVATRKPAPQSHPDSSIFLDDFVTNAGAGVPSPAIRPLVDGVHDVGATSQSEYRASDQSKPVVVAIDFGTTYSGIAFAHRFYPENIHYCAPSAVDFHIKVPTILLQLEDGTWEFGNDAEREYNEILLGHSGGSSSLPVHLYKRFKMALNNATSGFETLTAVSEDGKTHSLMELVTVTLRKLKECAMERFQNTFGYLVSSNENVQWVLTVPAIWNEFGKAFMRKAAFQAGLVNDENSNHLMLALEPECAALSVYQGVAPFKPLEALRRFMVLDCGGSAVNITVHEVAGVNPLTIKTLSVPTGGDWGGENVNQEFKKLLKELLGPEFLSREEEHYERYLIEKEFVRLKTQFDPARQPGSIRLTDILESRGDLAGLIEKYNATHPDEPILPNPAIRMGLLPISKETMLRFHEPCLLAIVNEMRKIMAHTSDIKEIVVVGGFGLSKVLTERINAEFHQKPGVRVIVPERLAPQVAVAHGAVILGLRKDIASSRIVDLTTQVHSKKDLSTNDRSDALKSAVRDVILPDPSWLGKVLRKKGVSDELILDCVQKLVEGEDFSTEEVFAQMSPEEFTVSYLRAIGITSLSAQNALISAHKEAVARFLVPTFPPAAGFYAGSVGDTLERTLANVMSQTRVDVLESFTRLSEKPQMATYDRALLQLVNNRKECPSLFWLYPKKRDLRSWLGHPVKRLFQNSMMMVVVCPVTLCAVKCGPDGLGWEINSPKVWMEEWGLVFLSSIYVMQAAVIAGRVVCIPLHIPPSQESLSNNLGVGSKTTHTSGELMTAFSTFAESMYNVVGDYYDTPVRQLCSMLEEQQRRHKGFAADYDVRRANHILNYVMSMPMFEKSYKSIHTFLTTGENAKLGKLEDQLRGSMERVMADDGDVEWVSAEAIDVWRQQHSPAKSSKLTGKEDATKESVTGITTKRRIIPPETQRKLQAFYEEYKNHNQATASANRVRSSQQRAVLPLSEVSSAEEGAGDPLDRMPPMRIIPEETIAAVQEVCCPLSAGDRVTLIAIRNDHVDHLRTALRHGYLHPTSCTEACKLDRLDCLKVLRYYGASWDETTTRAAAVRGHVTTLKYALEQGCKYGNDLVRCAAESGNLECLEYVVENQQIGLDESVFGAAFERAHFKCVAFLIERGCPFTDYNFGGKELWPTYQRLHTNSECCIDTNFLWCIKHAVVSGWRASDEPSSAYHSLIEYLCAYEFDFPLCIAHLVEEGWIV